jgi:beta-N-acetylhexosaminidase
MIAETARKLAGQVLVAGFPGLTLPPELHTAAARGELGGFVLFRRNLGDPSQIGELTAGLAAACAGAEAPPWVAVDQEGGRVQRLGRPVLPLPPMRSLGAIDDVALTERAAQVVGRQLAALGFNLDFAPVLDVDTYAESPIIGDRSFGTDAAKVTRHGRAFARGLEAAGVAACGKHYPGHGDAALDSHLALPRVAHDRARLDRVELAPFRELAAELSTLMTAHIVFDALDPERPATLSPKAIAELLRGELGFHGVIFSDDLEMKAIADHYGVEDAACAAIAAGCDAILVCSKPELCLRAHAALVKRAEGDAAFAARLADAAARNLAARRAHPLRPEAPARVAARLQELGDPALEERLARGAA